jgi:hypothetical protein
MYVLYIYTNSQQCLNLSPSSIRYIGLIDDFSFIPRAQWAVNLVIQELPTPDVEQGMHNGMCLPIFPTTHHPPGREALRPSSDFPWKNCYHHSHLGSKPLAVSTVHGANATGVRLSEEDVDRLEYYAIDDPYEARDASRQCQSGKMVAMMGNSAGGVEIVSEETPAQVPAPSDLSARTELPQSTSLIRSASAPGADVQPSSPSGGVVADGGGADPYDNFSDVTSIISSHDGLEVQLDAEAFHHALASGAAGEPVDPSSIVTTMEVWLDLTVFDSQTLPPSMDFEAEVTQISQSVSLVLVVRRLDLTIAYYFPGST